MTRHNKKLSIVLPVYNNAESLPELSTRIKGIEGKLLESGNELELIFVDDGSKDQSFDELKKIKAARPATKLIKLTRNFGSINACNIGFQYATGDCIAVLAVDLQDPPEQMLEMFGKWRQGHNFVLSYRQSRQDPWSSKVMAGIYYKMLDVLVVKGFPKGGVDMTLMDQSLLPHIKDLGKGVYFTLYLFHLGFEATFIPYDRQARPHGKSGWTLMKKIGYFLDTITGFSVTTLRLISAIGLIVSLLSITYGCFLIAVALATGTTTPGFVTLAVLISFSTAIIVAILGVIGEYLWRIFEMMNNRPNAVVAETYLSGAPAKEELENKDL